MPERAASVPYQPFPTVEAGGGGGTAEGVHANPADFGSQVAEAGEKAGNAGFDMALKLQGMANESAINNADASFAIKAGQIKAQYQSLTGDAAANGYAKYQADMQAAYQQTRATLGNPMSQKGFDMVAQRSMANHLSDGASYAATQRKEALIDSTTNLADANMKALLDPDTAKSDERSQYHMDSLKYAAQTGIDDEHPGLHADPETGVVSFKTGTPEGDDLKASYHQKLDTYLTQGYVNRYNTLAKDNPFGAYTKYQQERSDMPRGAQVALDAMFGPKLFAANVNNTSNAVLKQADQDHWQTLTNPSSAGSNAYNLGNVKTASGASNNTQEFVNPTTPVDGAILTANNLRGKQYEGLTLEQIGHKWTSTDPDNWVKNVSATSGIAPGTVPNLNDPAQLSAILKGIATAEKSPKDRAIFTDDIINQGAEASIAGKSPATSQAKSYATNENGAPLSKADYYALNRQQILENGDAYAERIMPGDLQMKRSVRQSLNNYMEATIQNQHVQYTMDNQNVVKAISDKSPQTMDDLRQMPGMSDLLDKVAYQDPKFSETIPTLIARFGKKGQVDNSPNGYETILRTLEPTDDWENHPNRIATQDQLDKMMGRTDGTGINIKDYNDAKQAIELDKGIKSNLQKGMKSISTANGNVDGLGQMRAVQWYNQVMQAYKQKPGDMSDADFADKISEIKPIMPSRMEQITNKAKQSADVIKVISPDGKTGTIPMAQLNDALQSGYKKAE